jgi:hypothetical protein
MINKIKEKSPYIWITFDDIHPLTHTQLWHVAKILKEDMSVDDDVM